MFSSLPDAVLYADAEWRILACNPAAVRLFGYDERELVGRETRFLYVDPRDFEEQGRLHYHRDSLRETVRYEVRYRRKSGEVFWGETHARVMRDAAGTVTGYLAILRDITEQRRWVQRRDLLVRMGDDLGSTLDPRQRLGILASIAVPDFADACTIYLLEGEGEGKGEDDDIRPAVAVHADPDKAEILRILTERYGLAPDAPHGYRQVMRSGISELIHAVDDDTRRRIARSPEHLELLMQLGIRSMVTAPLITAGRTIGALSLGITTEDRHFTQDDVILVEELARCAAVAFEHARLYEAARAAEAEAEARRKQLDGMVLQLRVDQEALAANEAKYRQIVETAREGIWIVDARGITTYANQRMAELLGYTVDELLGRSMYDFMDEAARAAAERLLELPRQGNDEQQDLRFLRKDGRDLWALMATNPLRDEAGRIMGALSMVTDVTERHLTEERSQVLIEVSRVLGTSLDMRELAALVVRTVIARGLASSCALELRDRGDGQSFVAVAHEDPAREAPLHELRQRYPLDRQKHPHTQVMSSAAPLVMPELTDQLLQALAQDEAHLALMRQIGTTTMISVPLIARGRAMGALSIGGSYRQRPYTDADRVWAQDLADRVAIALDNARLLIAEQQARKALEVSEEQFRTIANTMPQLAWIANPDGYITWYNQRWYEYTGTTFESQQGWGWTSVHEITDLPRMVALWKAALAQGISWEDTFRLRRASDGMYRWHLSRALPLRDAEGKIVRWFGTNVDIHEQKRSEQAAKLLAATGKMLEAALDVPSAIHDVIRIPIPAWAAGVEIVLASERGELDAEPMLAFADPGAEEQLRSLLRSHSLHPEHPFSVTFRTGESTLIQVDDDWRARATRSVEHRRLIEQLGVRSAAIVPLVARSRTLGILLLAATDRTYDREDLAVFEELGRRIAIAIDNVLLRQQLQERAAAAERSEQEYRFLAESAPQIVWTTQPDGTIDYVNQNFVEYVGMAREQVPAKLWQECLHPDEIERVAHTWAASMATGEPYSDELRIRGKDGQYRWFLVRARAMRDRAGNIVRWFGTTTNIDELKRAEAEVNALLDAAPTGIALFDTELRYLRINRALADMNDLPREAHLGQRVRELFPRVAEVVEPIFHRVLDTGEPVSTLEVSGLSLGGSRTSHYLANFYPVRVEGQIIGLASMVIDITERKRAEQRAELFAKTGAVLASSLDPARMIDEVARLVVAELGDWCTIYAMVDDEGAIELSAVHHVDPARAALIREIHQRYPYLSTSPHSPSKVLRAGQSVFLPRVTEEHMLAAAQSTEHLALMEAIGTTSWLLVPVAIQGRPYGALGVGFTTPQRHFDHRDLECAEELGRRLGVALDNARLFAAAQCERRRAEEAGRAKDEFLAVVSHELRTPLNAMLGWTRMLRTGSLDLATQARALETIERNAKAQAQLIEDILDVSRIITGKLRLTVGPVDLPQVIHAAVDTLRPAAEAKGVRLQLLVDPSAGPCMGDADRLQQVAANLVSNAVKFVPKGGRVQVRLTKTESNLELIVEDTGRGIEPAFLPFVFDRFRQAESGTTRSHGGLGLGLAIVKHLVELHGGTVRAHSEGEGKGATFIVCLPISPLRSAATSAPVHSLPGPTTSMPAVTPRPELAGLRVLVVDDEHDARELLRSVLSFGHIEAATAASVEEALRLVRALRPDVLVSDIGMPGEDGYELIRRLRMLPPDQGGNTPAVALTAYARMEDRTRALLAGFTMHASKPIEPAELFAVLASVSGRRPTT